MGYLFEMSIGCAGWTEWPMVCTAESSCSHSAHLFQASKQRHCINWSETRQKLTPPRLSCRSCSTRDPEESAAKLRKTILQSYQSRRVSSRIAMRTSEGHPRTPFLPKVVNTFKRRHSKWHVLAWRWGGVPLQGGLVCVGSGRAWCGDKVAPAKAGPARGKGRSAGHTVEICRTHTTDLQTLQSKHMYIYI